MYHILSKLILNLLIYVYSIIILIIKSILELLLPKQSKIKQWIINKKPIHYNLKKIQTQRKNYEKCIIFFCSSAGEYEQSLPLINKLKKDNIFIFILFFSISGFKFAKAKNEQTPYAMAPLDIIWIWKKIFQILQPTCIIINRHEFWPAFIYATNTMRIPLILINASNSSKSRLSIFTKILFMKSFDLIYVISKEDYYFYSKHLPIHKIFISGDTKYDRVIERLEIYKSQINNLKALFEKHYPQLKRFIVGSAWKLDIEYALTAYAQINTKYPNLWQLIIAPHDINKENINWIKNKCTTYNYPFICFSELEHKERCTTCNNNIDIIIIDIIGILFELYGSCQACMIGGALHNKIHNVLEPAAHGLFLCYGPRFYDQKEAILLKEHNLARIIYMPIDLYKFWEELSTNKLQYNHKIKTQILNMCGATEIIYDKLKQYL